MPILKDIFNPEQLQYLKKLVADNFHKLELNCDPERGRDDLYLGNEVDQSIKDTVLSYLPEGYYLNNITYSDYNNKYINPNLPGHTDPHGEHSLTFDYLLDTTIDWPLCIEQDCYSLLPNDALIFSPQQQFHFRPELTFKDGDSMKILFFQVKKLTSLNQPAILKV
jgi:hypothetical protein